MFFPKKELLFRFRFILYKSCWKYRFFFSFKLSFIPLFSLFLSLSLTESQFFFHWPFLVYCFSHTALCYKLLLWNTCWTVRDMHECVSIHPILLPPPHFLSASYIFFQSSPNFSFRSSVNRNHYRWSGGKSKKQKKNLKSR